MEVNGEPRIKLSEDFEKVTIPGRKKVYRLYGQCGYTLLDLMTIKDEPDPCKEVKILCRHPFFESKRAYVQPSKVELRHKKYWSNGKVALIIFRAITLIEFFLIRSVNLFHRYLRFGSTLKMS